MFDINAALKSGYAQGLIVALFVQFYLPTMECKK